MKYLLPLVVFALAARFPALANRAGAVLSVAASVVTRRAWMGALLAAALPMAIRLALLPWWPVPDPKIPDEFCYIYAADTFAAGRLVNPAHPLWHFFEAPHLMAHPAMYSKYPPAQGLMLAAGQLLFGDPWFGVWLSSGLLCAACYWLFLAMVPRRWALLGALIVSAHLGLTGYWMNSYWGGNVAAGAGAVMLGSFLRLRRRARPVWAATFAAGWTVLAASRPYEGAVLFAIPLAVALAAGKRRMPGRVWMSGAAAAAFGGLLLGGYNMAATGKPWKLPYVAHSERYSYVPPFAFMPLQPKPPVRQEILQATMDYDEGPYRKMNGPERFQWLGTQWAKILAACLPTILFLPLVLAVTLIWARRTRWLVALLGLGIAGLSVETFHFAHYFAPFVPLLLLLTVLALRSLTEGTWRRAVLAALLVGAAGHAALAVIREVKHAEPKHPVSLRPVIEAHLAAGFEDHLIFVRDTEFAGGLRPSWIYNRAAMEKAPVIWAADLGEEENAKLMRMYPERRVWRLPVKPPITLEPYGPGNPLREPVKFQK